MGFSPDQIEIILKLATTKRNPDCGKAECLGKKTCDFARMVALLVAIEGVEVNPEGYKECPEETRTAVLELLRQLGTKE